MTAPDDVRARFEAWATDEGYAVERYKDSYQAADTRNAWWGFQAAHADLAGEVRELVEAADEALDALHAHGVSEKCRAWIPSRDNTALNGLRAAIAKFHPTHQETKA